MKLSKITLAFLFSTGIAQAEYQIQINLGGEDIRFVNLTDASSIFGQWQNYGDIYGCSNWSPDPSSITISTQFIQTATDCKQNQIRTVQDRVLDTVSGKIVNKGSEYTQQQTLSNQSQTRNYTVYLSEWTNIGQLTDCTNWGPDPSTVNNGESFIQTATDCKQEQTRSRVEGYIDNKTGYSVEVLSENESIVLSGQSSTRTANGTKSVKVCMQKDLTNSTEFQTWISTTNGAVINTVGYGGVPAMVVNVNTGRYSLTNAVIPGLTKISATEFHYNDGSKIWRITRGSYVMSASGIDSYHLCFE